QVTTSTPPAGWGRSAPAPCSSTSPRICSASAVGKTRERCSTKLLSDSRLGRAHRLREVGDCNRPSFFSLHSLKLLAGSQRSGMFDFLRAGFFEERPAC